LNPPKQKTFTPWWQRGRDGGRWAVQQSQARSKTMLQKQSVSLADARRLIEAAEAKALEIGSPSNIAVADAGGHLVAHVRMDGAWMGSINISINKAFTARMFDIATKDLAELAQPGKPFLASMCPITSGS
jgi:uncharacterized protein GlcG (DUF336 family)